MIYVLYVLAGIVSGVFGGLGMGGGTLLIPILTIFLNFDQKLSQGINLLSFLVMAIFSMIIHYKNGYIVTKHIAYIIVAGVVFSILGAFAMSLIPSKILKMIFGFLMATAFIGIAMAILMKRLIKKNKLKEEISNN